MTTFLGGGIGYRTRHRSALLSAGVGEGPELLEVIPAHFFADPDAIVPLAERYPLVFHEVGLSVGTAPGGGGADRALLRRVQRLVDLARPALFSDHLAITRSPDGIDLGHLAPLWYTREMLALVVDRVRAWQDVLGVEVALENIAMPFVIGEADMSEPEFFTRLVDTTGCKILLDVTNLLYNARNLGFDAADRLAQYPLHSVVQIHLAGGRLAHGFWVDSHSRPVEQASFALLEALRGRAPVRAIVVERDEELPGLDDLVDEAKQAARIWREGVVS